MIKQRKGNHESFKKSFDDKYKARKWRTEKWHVCLGKHAAISLFLQQNGKTRDNLTLLLITKRSTLAVCQRTLLPAFPGELRNIPSLSRCSSRCRGSQWHGTTCLCPGQLCKKERKKLVAPEGRSAWCASLALNCIFVFSVSNLTKSHLPTSPGSTIISKALTPHVPQHSGGDSSIHFLVPFSWACHESAPTKSIWKKIVHLLQQRMCKTRFPPRHHQ